MLYTAQVVFINGETVPEAMCGSALLRTLADRRTLDAQQFKAATPPERTLLVDWCAQGWLTPLRDSAPDAQGTKGKHD
jgi:hypothetical protein